MNPLSSSTSQLIHQSTIIQQSTHPSINQSNHQSHPSQVIRQFVHPSMRPSTPSINQSFVSQLKHQSTLPSGNPSTSQPFHQSPLVVNERVLQSTRPSNSSVISQLHLHQSTHHPSIISQLSIHQSTSHLHQVNSTHLHQSTRPSVNSPPSVNSTISQLVHQSTRQSTHPSVNSAIRQLMTMTTTTTMTHSDCLQRSQKPCPTDVSDGVMTPVKRICRTVYCPAQRTELETSCDVR